MGTDNEINNTRLHLARGQRPSAELRRRRMPRDCADHNLVNVPSLVVWLLFYILARSSVISGRALTLRTHTELLVSSHQAISTMS